MEFWKELLEIVMLICFGFSWPINVVKAYKARTAKATSLTFILLIIIGYIAGIAAKIINISLTGKFSYSLIAYIINIIVVSLNLVVYFRNVSLDKKREQENK